MSDHETTDARAALAPLRRIEPTDEAIAAVLAAHDRREPERRPRRWRLPRARPRWTTAAGLTAVTAALLVAVLALPPSSPDGGGKRDDPPSAFSILSTAAANAAKLPGTGGGYGYTKRLIASTVARRTPFGPASFVVERTVETWIDARSSGAERYGDKRVSRTSGSPRAQAWTSPGSAGDRSLAGARRRATRPDRDLYGHPLPALRRYHAGDGELLALDPATLPASPDALRRRLIGSVDAKAGRRENAEDVRSRLVAYEIALLADARTPPKVRAALFSILARTPGGRADGPGRDASGRSGQRIAIAIPAPRHGGAIGYRLLVEPRTARLLEWQVVRPLPGAAPSDPTALGPAESAGVRIVILAQRMVSRAPALPSLPARCTDGLVAGIPPAYQRPGTLMVGPDDALLRTSAGRRMLDRMRRRGATVIRISAAEKRRFDALRAQDQRGCAGG